MQRILLALLAVFEIICGFFGLVIVVGGITGRLPYGIVSALWFGIFPLVSLLAGVLLLLRWKHAVMLSILVQLLQVPFIYTDGFLLNLGLPLNLTITASGMRGVEEARRCLVSIFWLWGCCYYCCGVGLLCAMCLSRTPHLTTHSTRAEIAWMSFAGIECFSRFFPPRQFGR